MGGEAGANNRRHGHGLSMLTRLKPTGSDAAQFSPHRAVAGGHAPFLHQNNGQEPVRIVRKHIVGRSLTVADRSDANTPATIWDRHNRGTGLVHC
jgi:hypothetical protein